MNVDYCGPNRHTVAYPLAICQVRAFLQSVAALVRRLCWRRAMDVTFPEYQ